MIDFRNKIFDLCFLFLLHSIFSISYAQTIYTSSGTLTVPNGVCKITVEVVGGGGGGGYSDDRGMATGGGGGGGFAMATLSVTAGQRISYVVGVGGSGGSGTGNGGDSWFLSTTSILAEGGRGVVNNSTTGGNGGSGFVNATYESILIRTGGRGGNGSGDGDCNATGGGASAAGPNGNGVNGVNGNRGSGITCSGKQGGNGGVLSNAWFASVGGRGNENGVGGQGVVGNNASGFGAGGGGGKRGSALILEGGAKNGGNGSQGIIRVTYHNAPTVSVTGPIDICSGGFATLNTTAVNTARYSWSQGATTASINVSPMNSTLYTVTAYSDKGCVATASHTVNVTTASVKPASISGIGQYCIGNEVTLTQVGGFTGANFEWYSESCGGTLLGVGNSISITPTANMNVFVRAQQNGVCPSSLCESGVIEVNQVGNTLALDRDIATCPVRENNWVHFYKDNRLVASINSGGQNLGLVTATSFVDPTNQLIPACEHLDNELFMTSVMNRHWVLTPEFQPNLPVRVRLPFYNGDFDNLMDASIGNLNPTDNVYTVGEVFLSKYHGTINVNDDALDNCAGLAFGGGTDLFEQAASGAVSAYAPIANAQFVEYVIPNFSEFWLHGSSELSPLGKFLNDFDVLCGKMPTVQIELEQINLIASAVLYSSRDGNSWINIKEWQLGQNNSNNLIISHEDILGNNPKYYKIELYGHTGKQLLHKIVTSDCLATISDLQLYPNPATNKVHVKWASESLEADYLVLSIDGKSVIEGSVKRAEAIDVEFLAAGSYTVMITLKSGERAMQHLIKQ